MKNFFKIIALEVLQLNSKTGAVFTGRITFKELLKIHRLTERKESLVDPFGENNSNRPIDDEEFQRHLNNNKLIDLRKFLETEFEDINNSKIIFPSSVIISLDLNENNSSNLSDEQIDNLYENSLNSCFVIERDFFSEIYIPKTERICLIVDGQHRFYGLKKFYDSLKDKSKKDKVLDFQFITSILLGYDTFQVAEVFANVNFNQKPVNKSLYYDIFGSSVKEKNEIQLAHFLALHMQNNEGSPLKGMIKLLGNGYGLFSQAFFVEKLLIHFKENGAWIDQYEDYLSDGEDYLGISTFLKAYFNAIRDTYKSCWPQRVEREGELVYSSYAYNYILCKTTGMGAFFRLIKAVFPLTKNLKDQKDIYEKCRSIFSKININEAERLFSKEGEFGKGGSEGFQIRLFKELRKRYEI